MNTNICFPDEYKREFVEAINNGVGDDVKRNLRNERIDPKFSNSKGNSVYDYINRNIRELKLNRFTTEYAKVNGWKYLPVFDNNTGYIYLLMKKSRYEGILLEKKEKRKKVSFFITLIRVLRYLIRISNQNTNRCRYFYHLKMKIEC